MNRRDALRELYGPPPWDMTWRGLREALGERRKTDPTSAQRIRRGLNDLLTGSRPEGDVGAVESSKDTAERVALLPNNPHLHRDLRAACRVLGILEGLLAVPRESVRHGRLEDVLGRTEPALTGGEDPSDLRRELEWELISRWLYVHVRPDAERLERITGEGWYPDELLQTAVESAAVDLESADSPDWLRGQTGEDGDGTTPPAWRVARTLVVRHRLPAHIVGPMLSYLLTLNAAWVDGLEPLSVELDLAGERVGKAFGYAVRVTGLDQVSRKEDWTRIWERSIRPELMRIAALRNIDLEGRRSDLARLREALPDYAAAIGKGLGIADAIRDSELLGVSRSSSANWRVFRELDRLLHPAATLDTHEDG